MSHHATGKRLEGLGREAASKSDLRVAENIAVMLARAHGLFPVVHNSSERHVCNPLKSPAEALQAHLEVRDGSRQTSRM